MPILLFVTTIQAQINSRILIKGKINVSIESDASGINVYNLSTTKGTITDDYGEFLIAVAKGDKLYFSGVQYQDFTVEITEDIIKNKKLNITINEAVTELEEVTVRPYGLSGNVEVDLQKIKTQDVNLPNTGSLELVETYDYELSPDEKTKVHNDAIDKSYLTNGLNFANIFREIFNSKDKNSNKNVIQEDIDVKIRKVYNDDFFRKNLDIKRENINEFIFYAEEHGLHKEMLKEGNELALIQFLIEKSKAYKMQQNK